MHSFRYVQKIILTYNIGICRGTMIGTRSSVATAHNSLAYLGLALSGLGGVAWLATGLVTLHDGLGLRIVPCH